MYNHTEFGVLLCEPTMVYSKISQGLSGVQWSNYTIIYEGAGKYGER